MLAQNWPKSYGMTTVFKDYDPQLLHMQDSIIDRPHCTCQKTEVFGPVIKEGLG